MKVLMLSGVGGVGKTSYCQELKKILDPFFNICFVPSPVREVTADAGFKTELDCLKTDDEKLLAVQNKILNVYLTKMQEAILGRNIDLVLSDRHPADYLSYLQCNYQRLTVAQHETRKSGVKFLLQYIDNKWNASRFTLSCPFPVSWNTGDYYRESPFMKNYIWDVVRQHELACLGDVPEILSVKATSPEQRARNSLVDTRLYHWLKS